MPLLARTIATPLAIEIREGAVNDLAPLLQDGKISSGGRVAVVVGPGRGDAVASRLFVRLPQAEVLKVTEGSLDAAIELQNTLRHSFYDAVVAVGGGRTIDTAKYAASMSGLPLVVVATTLTHDGIASPVASLEHRGRKASYGVHVPIAVFVDIAEIRTAPPEHLSSGIGDALSNLSAIADWELAREVRGEPIDGLAATMARSAGEAVLRTEARGDQLLTTVADALILSGLAMVVAGSSRPCSGACHEISHALDAFHGSPGLHGAQVAFGARFATWLRGDEALLAELDDALLRHQLPRTPKKLGIDRDAFVAAVLQAPTTRPDRFTILEHHSVEEDEWSSIVDHYLSTL